MKFRRFSNWAEVSECGRYTVSAARSDGLWSFQAWRRGRFEGAAPTLLGTHKFAQDARELCDLDVSKQKAAA